MGPRQSGCLDDTAFRSGYHGPTPHGRPDRRERQEKNVKNPPRTPAAGNTCSALTVAAVIALLRVAGLPAAGLHLSAERISDNASALASVTSARGVIVSGLFLLLNRSRHPLARPIKPGLRRSPGPGVGRE